MQLPQREHFRDCSHSFMFRPPCSLGLQVAPTTGVLPTGQPGRLPHATLGWLPAPRCGIATCPNRVIDMVGLAPTGLWPCRLLPVPMFRRGLTISWPTSAGCPGKTARIGPCTCFGKQALPVCPERPSTMTTAGKIWPVSALPRMIRLWMRPAEGWSACTQNKRGF